MANTLTFTPGGSGGAALTVTPVPGSVQWGGGNEDRGGSEIPQSRAALARNGSCQVVLDSSGTTQANIETLLGDTCEDSTGAASPIGLGAVTVTGAGDYAAIPATYLAIVDAVVEGDAVLVATINWKGSAVNPA